MRPTVFVGMTALMRVIMFMRMRVPISMSVLVRMTVIMLMIVVLVAAAFAMLVLVLMFVVMPVFMGMCLVRVVMIGTFVGVLFVTATFVMRRPTVDVKFYPLNVLPLRTVVVHVKMTKVQLFNFPFQSAGLHAEIDECANCHVTANS